MEIRIFVLPILCSVLFAVSEASIGVSRMVTPAQMAETLNWYGWIFKAMGLDKNCIDDIFAHPSTPAISND